MNQGKNIYTPSDSSDITSVPGQKVFLSHRSADKPIMRSISSLLSALDVHYWFDEQDHDLQYAAALGMIGDKGVVHSIERGIRHSTAILGLVSSQTRGSWWVPYEIGYSRASNIPVSFLVLDIGGMKSQLPEYARIASLYWSVDELARWVSTLAGYDLHSNLTHIPEGLFAELEQYIPLDPPNTDFLALCKQAIEAIELLGNPSVHPTLALNSEHFDWLPSDGGSIREIAYDLLAPLAYFRLGLPIEKHLQNLARTLYSVPIEHYEIAQIAPQLPYQPETSGWRYRRYQTPAQVWLQGMRKDQLDDRIDQFLTTLNRKGKLRLATKEEFKAEFDRALSSNNDQLRRSLGVLINPLFGFTPKLRPVFWRILAIQHHIYSIILKRDTNSGPFNDETKMAVSNYRVYREWL